MILFKPVALYLSPEKHTTIHVPLAYCLTSQMVPGPLVAHACIPN